MRTKTVAAMDLLAPGVGEIIGGSRGERATCWKRMAEFNIDPRNCGGT